MASIQSGSRGTINEPLSDRARWTALVIVTALFFMWGFITVLNDILVPHLKGVFELNYTRAALIQFVFFGAYFLMSLPSGVLVSRLGYKRTMVAGLVTAAAGTLLFLPAAAVLSYALFLGALFVLATGITILQVSANPYISALGNPETASSRLNLAQAFNSLGTTIAPALGGALILSHQAAAAQDKMAEAASVKVPYLILTGILLLLGVIIALTRLPTISAVEGESGREGTLWDAIKVPRLSLGAIGIFLYVGAEVAIGSFLINYLGEKQIAGLDEPTAAQYVSLYWGGAMVGRFIGSALLQFVKPNRLLAFNATVTVALSVTAFLASGYVAMWAALLIGVFNSIMFPNIFTLGIRDLGHLTGKGSSLLVMAIVGGAIVPQVMGYAADKVGVHHSFFIPALCYLFIIYYGWRGHRK
ncbi:MAG: sugar MFS transporter [Verrucomicrobiales bacterium]|jgi:FHS family L-fucose permease-like MFS transporter|nr:sugar MFS transporter [Verrucomicrobiales bacterium]